MCSRSPFSTHHFPLNDNGNGIVRRIKYDLFVVDRKFFFFARGAKRGPTIIRETCDTGCFYTVAIADNKYKVKIILNIFRGVCGDTRLFRHKSANAENRFSERTAKRERKNKNLLLLRAVDLELPRCESCIEHSFPCPSVCLFHFLFSRSASSPMNRKRAPYRNSLALRMNIPILPVGLTLNSGNRCKLKSLYCSLVMGILVYYSPRICTITTCNINRSPFDSISVFAFHLPALLQFCPHKTNESRTALQLNSTRRV